MGDDHQRKEEAAQQLVLALQVREEASVAWERAKENARRVGLEPAMAAGKAIEAGITDGDLIIEILRELGKT